MRWMCLLARCVLSTMPAARRSPNFHEPTGSPRAPSPASFELGERPRPNSNVVLGAAACSHRGAARPGAKGQAVSGVPHDLRRGGAWSLGVFDPSGVATIRGHRLASDSIREALRAMRPRVDPKRRSLQVREGRRPAAVADDDDDDRSRRAEQHQFLRSAASQARRATDVSSLAKLPRALPRSLTPLALPARGTPSGRRKLRPRSVAKRRQRAAHTLALKCQALNTARSRHVDFGEDRR